jgi:hypothetical protein
MAKLHITKTGAGFLIDASAKTYETVVKQIREFISNALDAGASKVNIEIVPTKKALVITDNGCGMTDQEFLDNYLVIGCSSKYGDPDTIGRIGVGKFSAIPLCKSMSIRTKKESTDKVYAAELSLWKLQEPSNRDEDVTGIDLGNGNYVEASVDDPGPDFTEKGGFTKMVLTGVPESVEYAFTDEEAFNELCKELGRALPLSYSESSIALQKLRPIDTELVDELLEAANEESISVTIYTPKYPEGREVYRSLFGDDVPAGEEISGDIYPIVSHPESELAPIKIIGYFADMTSGTKAYVGWRGLNVRVKNTTVGENYYFSYSNPPVQIRTTGEIHLLGVDEESLITMNRSGFATEFEQYRIIDQWITDKLTDFGSRYVRMRTQFNADMKSRKEDLKNRLTTSVKIEKAVREVFEEKGVEVDISLLEKKELKKEDEIDQEKRMLEDHSRISEVIPVPPATTDTIEATEYGGNFIVRVPSNLLQYELQIQDEDYELKYVDHDAEEPIIDVDVEEKTIRVNENAPPVKKGKNWQLVLAIFLLEYAFAAFPDDLNMLKEKVIEAINVAFQ